MPDTVALAFSGGLDTSYCVLDLIKRGYRVVYLVTDEQVEIVTVREGHRLMPDDPGV